MRLRHPDGTVVHLGYGTNVLPAEDVDGLIAQVGTYGDRLRQHLRATIGVAPGSYRRSYRGRGVTGPSPV